MAKLTYKLNVMDFIEDFSTDFDLTVAKSGKTATWESEDTGAKVVVTGSKLERAEEGDHFDGGSITGLTVFNGNNKAILEITNLNLKATKLTSVFEDDDLLGALNLVVGGNDNVIGSKKDDYLFSGGGNDV